ncbi:hypothetical protein FE257_006575 [Aspergillus nanangensis]|uniref:Cytochrome P450 n=1 Tax=Aspergillus nanangensis TaxID=2582783 RepID=A0AAD4GZF0_ASPNN|nr:hypothetical protein FE257_006575 [Aspergillus nanangensis]
MNPAFSARNLQDFEPYMSQHIHKLLNCLRRQLEPSKSFEVDFNKYSNFLAFDVIGDFAFGESFNFLDREEDYLNLIEAIDARGEVLNALGHAPLFLRPLIKWLPFDPFWSQGLRGTKSLGVIGTKAYFERKSQSGARKDLLSYLFNAKDPQTGGNLEEKEIIAESISFIVGGSDTTSTSMTNVVDIVSRSRKLLEVLQKELDGAFPGELAPDWVAPFKEVESLPILNAIVRETMRIRPTSATGLERVTPKGGKVIAGNFVPEGTLVSVPTLAIHRCPSAFMDAETFFYERWLEKDSGALLDSFVPFSVGPRACIGRNFAWMEMLKTLATLFKLFDMERTHAGGTPSREGFFMKTKECRINLKLRQIPRS